MRRIYKNSNVGVIKFIDYLGDIILFYKKKKKFNKENIKKILVVRLDHIGDMVLLSSFLRNLKNNFPNSEITVLCRRMTKDVLECIPYVDNIQVLNVPWLSRNDGENWKNILRYLIKHYKKYDLAIDLRGKPIHNIIVSLVGKYSTGYGYYGLGFLLNKEVIWENKPKHIVGRNLDILKALDLSVDNGKLGLKVDKEYYESLKSKLDFIEFDRDFVIVCHPISGNKCKNWLFNYWNKLNNLILNEYNNNENLKILYGGSKNNYNDIGKNINIDNKNIFNIAGKLSLKEYFALVDLCDLLISVDTFAVHVRAAFDKPLIGIYSGTNYLYEWGPYTEKKTIFQDKSCHFYPCESFECLADKHICMENIKPETIFKAFKKLRDTYDTKSI
ncbi:glycosyltransferase family 9 protein [Methanococcus aeolicus]|uniref:glycosyltransferase family 9 protein n=1 Tax=Methanococcus aeolicus TaxID=42879 RepID=UPI0021C83D09|nr:glycosyltransferase family 9 protein [Methanococcus aeolicus]UXM85419.1 glycosyltransferase family 9 protein [Methanococcus aeolicus]